MHETSLGGVIVDYLSGKARERTTYEDLRQALAGYLVEKKGYTRECLAARFPVDYEVAGEGLTREADIAVFSSSCLICLMLFCPGQINTYVRESQAMARLALPDPAPLIVVTDMKEAALVAVHDGSVLADGLRALPGKEELERLALLHPCPAPDAEHRDRESRILHAYTGFLKTCCGATCTLPGADHA